MPAVVERYRDRMDVGLRPWEEALLDGVHAGAANVLVIGCGTGREAFALVDRGVEVVAVDVTAALLELGRAVAASIGSSIRFVRTDGTTLPFEDSHRRIRAAIAASQTSLTELFGVGPVIACYLIGFTGDIGRFANRDAYAAYNGTAPVERSSGGRVVHRVSQRGNRRLNHALHLAAICQIRQRHSEGRAYYERKLAEGKTNKDAVRSLKRHISNAVYRQLLLDANRTR